MIPWPGRISALLPRCSCCTMACTDSWVASSGSTFGKAGSGRFRLLCPSFRNLIDEVLEFGDEIDERSVLCGLFTNDHIVSLGVALDLTERLAKPAPLPVAPGRAADRLGRGHAHIPRARQSKEAERWARRKVAVTIDLFKPAFGGAVYAEILCRPFRRRRRRTFWPSCDSMRTRNPCFLLRLRLFG